MKSEKETGSVGAFQARSPEETAARIMHGRPCPGAKAAGLCLACRNAAAALRAAELRGYSRGIEEAARALENPTLPGDLPFREAADVVRALSGERAANAAPSSSGIAGETDDPGAAAPRSPTDTEEEK